MVGNENTAAVFACVEFRVLPDFQNLLGWDTTVAPAAGVPLNWNNSQAALGVPYPIVPLSVILVQPDENFLPLMLKFQLFLLVFLVHLPKLLFSFAEVVSRFLELLVHRFKIPFGNLHLAFERFHIFFCLEGLFLCRIDFPCQRIVLLVGFDIELLVIVLFNFFGKIDNIDISFIAVNF